MDALRSQLQQALAGTYAIERELGGGGMSRVFLAKETALDNPSVHSGYAPLPPSPTNG